MIDTPQLDLPVKVTVIAHPTEKTSKSSIVPAKLLAPNSVDFVQTTEVAPFAEKNEEIALLFPGDQATQMSDLTDDQLKRIKRVVLIDSTWS
jgi:DTW domain-containing protein YfiP